MMSTLFLFLNKMIDLISHQDIIRDKVPKDKSRLSNRNYHIKNGLNLIGYGFRNQFVDYIT